MFFEISQQTDLNADILLKLSHNRGMITLRCNLFIPNIMFYEGKVPGIPDLSLFVIVH